MDRQRFVSPYRVPKVEIRCARRVGMNADWLGVKAPRSPLSIRVERLCLVDRVRVSLRHLVYSFGTHLGGSADFLQRVLQ